MADAILVGGGGGGVHSDDVTAGKAQVLSGYNTVTTDSNDEVVGGTMQNNGAVTHSLAVNGSYTIPAGFHNGSGRVSQSIPTKGAATYYVQPYDQTIAANQWLSGVQTLKALTVSGLGSSVILKGRTVIINNGYGDLYNVPGSNYVLMYVQSSAKGSATDRIGLSLRNNSTGDTLTRYFYYVDVIPGFTPEFVVMVSDGIVWRYSLTQFNYASASLTGQMDLLDPSQAPFTANQCRIFFPTFNASYTSNVWFWIFGY